MCPDRLWEVEATAGLQRPQEVRTCTSGSAHMHSGISAHAMRAGSAARRRAARRSAEETRGSKACGRRGKTAPVAQRYGCGTCLRHPLLVICVALARKEEYPVWPVNVQALEALQPHTSAVVDLDASKAVGIVGCATGSVRIILAAWRGRWRMLRRARRRGWLRGGLRWRRQRGCRWPSHTAIHTVSAYSTKCTLRAWSTIVTEAVGGKKGVAVIGAQLRQQGRWRRGCRR